MLNCFHLFSKQVKLFSKLKIIYMNKNNASYSLENNC